MSLEDDGFIPWKDLEGPEFQRDIDKARLLGDEEKAKTLERIRDSVRFNKIKLV